MNLYFVNNRKAVYNMKYKNYGDIGFLDYGRLVAMDKYGFDIICCDPDGLGGYTINTVYIWYDDIDINNNDSWIDHKAVMEFSDIHEVSTIDQKIMYALACIDYYGKMEFSGESWYDRNHLDSTQVLDYISTFDIEW